MRAAAALLFTLLPIAAFAEKPKLPEAVTVDGKSLVLNGIGMRQATVFNVNVYAAGLYVEKKSSNADELIQSDVPKQLIMHFVRDVEKDSLVEAYEEGFSKSANSDLAPRIKRFVGFLSDVKENDRIVLTYVPSKGLSVSVHGQEAGTIVGADFMKALFTIYLGPKPPNESLKKGLLGL